ncbi:hypothetical protein GCM10022240_17600 [Microbacterium kribbense]|uniref:DUF402 domain-containing protein n=1 Tax=Microbacterium kribbense TaxID=433645 RepID=A0ABP7GLJ0_9MICO
MSDPSRPAPGSRLMFAWRKWDGSPHWQHECVYLGADRWGDWVGQRTGMRSTRPGRELIAAGPNVTLIPPTGTYAVTVNTASTYLIYIDLAWDLHWQDSLPTGIDMDLDVVRTPDGRIWIDDEDEWDQHRTQLGYPPDVVAALPPLAADLKHRVEASAPPFDPATGTDWLTALAALAP